MSKDTFKYSNDDMTVVWKPKTCIHSALCFTGLLHVFNPKERPWVKMDGAGTKEIIDQVNKCPSGALSYFMNDLSAQKAPKHAEQAPTPEQAMNPSVDTITKVEVTADGPYIVNADCRIVYSDGREEIKAGKIALCRCGNSGNKPYCDGSHKRTGFKG